MNKIIVRPNETKDCMLSLTDKVIERLLSLGLSIYMDEKYRPFNINGVCFYSIPPRDADLLIVLGGDGSVIDASVLALELDIPLLGINLGKVGYLATLDPDEIYMLSVLIDGNSIIDEKDDTTIIYIPSEKNNSLIAKVKVLDNGAYIYEK